jgi:hypothetical protein
VGRNDYNIKFTTYVRRYLCDDDDDSDDDDDDGDVCWIPLLYTGILSLLSCGTYDLCDHKLRL